MAVIIFRLAMTIPSHHELIHGHLSNKQAQRKVLDLLNMHHTQSSPGDYPICPGPYCQSLAVRMSNFGVARQWHWLIFIDRYTGHWWKIAILGREEFAPPQNLLLQREAYK